MTLKKTYYIESWWQWVKFFVLSFIIAFILQAFILVPMKIEGNSMEDTLTSNSYVITERFSKIERFDIIVFHLNDGTNYVKRVIGLPGEEVIYKNDHLYINGTLVEEPFLKDKISGRRQVFTRDFTSNDIFSTAIIPEDTYLVLGDNRPFSKDSLAFGGVHKSQIIGKVRFVYYPISQMKFFN